MATSRWQLAFAAAAVLLGAADTYVVVVVLPSVMSGVGLGIDSLSRATPIISGFLLGYVAVLPLLGRLTDLLGREPIFVACTALFGLGSLLTATAHTLPVVVAGRALQGVGGGGLIPVTLALVAARWPVERRGLPLGAVGAVQELGSVLGPLYGTAVVQIGSWRTIFWINLPVVAFLGVAFARTGRSAVRAGQEAGHVVRTANGRETAIGADLKAGAHRLRLYPGVPLVLGIVAFALGLDAPSSLTSQITLGRLFLPLLGGPAWAQLTSPLTLSGAGLVCLAVALATRRAPQTGPPPRHPAIPPGLHPGTDPAPAVDLGAVAAALRMADVPGALLLATVLGSVVVIFSTADPSRQVVASSAPVASVIGGLALAGLILRQRTSPAPLIEPAVLANKASVGSLLVNLVIGAGLIAALVDVPLFARATVDPTSQVAAALILVRFLVAIPIGALVGGLLCRRASRGAMVAGAGSALAAVAFGAMTSWGTAALATPLRIGGRSWGIGASDVELVACGLGFGLVIAPVNAAVLAAVPARLHGLATSLAVVARTVGMLAGLSVLTAVGIRRFDEAQSRIGSPFRLCPTHPGSCPAYDRASSAALLGELHTIFTGAACCAGAATLLALVLLRVPGEGQGSRRQGSRRRGSRRRGSNVQGTPGRPRWTAAFSAGEQGTTTTSAPRPSSG